MDCTHAVQNMSRTPDLRNHENESTDLLLSSSFAAILNSSSWTIWLTFSWLIASSEMGRPSSFWDSASQTHSCLQVLTRMRGEKRCFISLPVMRPLNQYTMVMIAGRVQLAVWIDDSIGLGGVKVLRTCIAQLQRMSEGVIGRGGI
jgi:hypothetical protein